MSTVLQPTNVHIYERMLVHLTSSLFWDLCCEYDIQVNTILTFYVYTHTHTQTRALDEHIHGLMDGWMDAILCSVAHIHMLYVWK